MLNFSIASLPKIVFANTKRAALFLALLYSGAALSDVNVGPFFEYDAERKFTAVRPLWSSTPSAEDVIWPLGTWHSNEDQFWYRYLFLIYGHEGSFNLFPLWFSETEREADEFRWALFPLYGSHPHMLFMDDIHFACIWIIL